MKKLSELYKINSDILIKNIKINSKDVKEGDIFICTKGVTPDFDSCNKKSLESPYKI